MTHLIKEKGTTETGSSNGGGLLGCVSKPMRTVRRWMEKFVGEPQTDVSGSTKVIKPTQSNTETVLDSQKGNTKKNTQDFNDNNDENNNENNADGGPLDDDHSLTPQSSDIYSGDEDDLQTDLERPIPSKGLSGYRSTASLSTQQLPVHKRLRQGYASSIIGGIDVTDQEGDSTFSTGYGKDSRRKNTGTPANASRKIFNFSLPFTNPSISQRLSSIPLLGGISSNSSKLPSLQFKLGAAKKEQAEDAIKREEIRNKLERQQSLSTVEETFYYKDITKLNDGKMVALRKAITPSLSNDGWGNPIFDKIEGDILVMGGYRGSILRDATTNRRAWIPVLKAGLNIKKINLLLGPKDEDELKATDTIYPDGMLTHIGPVDISRKLIERLASNPKVTVHNWGYDWRLSIDLICERLHEALKKIYLGNGGKPIIIVAHSMGGIVAHGAMIKEPKLVRGIIYGGTPMPCVNVMGPLRYNDNILLCNDLLTSEVNFMMRSTFIFIPFKNQCLFKDIRTGKHYDIDFYDPKMWVKYNLSPIVSSVRLKQERGEPVDIKQQSKFSISFADAYDYLCRTLKKTKKFKESLKYNPDVNYPPLVVVYGNKVPSVKYSLVDGEEDIRKGIYYNFFYGPGDGVTHEKWVFPKDANYPLCAKFASQNGHIGLLSDAKCMAKAFEAIFKEEQRRKRRSH